VLTSRTTTHEFVHRLPTSGSQRLTNEWCWQVLWVLTGNRLITSSLLLLPLRSHPQLIRVGMLCPTCQAILKTYPSDVNGDSYPRRGCGCCDRLLPFYLFKRPNKSMRRCEDCEDGPNARRFWRMKPSPPPEPTEEEKRILRAALVAVTMGPPPPPPPLPPKVPRTRRRCRGKKKMKKTQRKA